MADLNDDQRAQLDGLVQQMHANHETDDYIQGVVNDFKAKHAGPFDVQKRNAAMRDNMAKQNEGRVAPSFAHEFARGVEEGTTPTDAGVGRRLLGSAARVGPGRAMVGSEQVGAGDYKKGAHNLIAGGSATAAMMFAPEILANPVTAASALALGTAGDMVGRKTAETLGGDEDTQNLAGDLGGFVGGMGGAKVGRVIPTTPVLRFAGGEMARPGGVQGVVGRTVQAAADTGEELSHRLRGPVQDVLQPSAESVARTRNTALDDAAKIVTDTNAAQRDEAIATNRHIDKNRAIAAKALAAKDPRAMTPAEVAQVMRSRLGIDTPTPGEDVSVPQPNGGPGGPAPQGTGQTRTADMPLWQQQQAMENGEILTGHMPAEPPPNVRGTIPIHAQEGAGGRGQEVTPPPTETPDLSNVPDGKNARPNATNATLVEDAGGPNASSESAASREALSRMNGMKARGEEFVVKRGTTLRKLVGPEAVDYVPQKGETFGIRAKDGTFRPLSQSEIKTALTGNRRAGAMPIAMRRALFNALDKRSK